MSGFCASLISKCIVLGGLSRHFLKRITPFHTASWKPESEHSYTSSSLHQRFRAWKLEMVPKVEEVRHRSLLTFINYSVGLNFYTIMDTCYGRLNCITDILKSDLVLTQNIKFLKGPLPHSCLCRRFTGMPHSCQKFYSSRLPSYNKYFLILTFPCILSGGDFGRYVS